MRKYIRDNIALSIGCFIRYNIPNGFQPIRPGELAFGIALSVTVFFLPLVSLLLGFGKKRKIVNQIAGSCV